MLPWEHTVIELRRPAVLARNHLAGFCGGAADRDVIGMPIAAVRAKRHDDVGLERTDRGRDVAGKRRRVNLRERAIAIVEALDVLDAKLRTRRPELVLTHDPQGGTRGGARVLNLAGLPPRRAQNHRLAARRCPLGQRSPDTEDFVIGMGEDPQEAPRWGGRYSLVLHGSALFVTYRAQLWVVGGLEMGLESCAPDHPPTDLFFSACTHPEVAPSADESW